MTEVICNYPDREAAIVAYLYGDDSDFGGAERVAFETHVNTCFACRGELAGFRGVRSTLAKWDPPEPQLASEPRAASPGPRAWWHNVPVWAQVAAAMLVLGVSASIANLDVRYDRAHGLTVRTGWSSSPAPAAPAATQTAAADSAPWRADLAALRQEMQSDMRAQAAAVRTAQASASAAPPPAISDADFTRRVRVLIDESEKRQEQALALHFVQLQNDMNAQRSGDLRRTNQLFRDVMNTYGSEIVKQRQQINYLLPASSAAPAPQR